MLKRLFDIYCALVSLSMLFPLMLAISILIALDSKGGIFYYQERIGKRRKPFEIIKFRTMVAIQDKHQQDRGLTVGNDNRITHVGKWLRKFKLDELPQLFNILLGEMSFVGPRPDIPKYAEIIYQLEPKMFSVTPGLTDYASIYFVDESSILAHSKDPERTYIEDILPKKITLSRKYINNPSFFTDIKIIVLTIIVILRKI